MCKFVCARSHYGCVVLSADFRARNISSVRKWRWRAPLRRYNPIIPRYRSPGGVSGILNTLEYQSFDFPSSFSFALFDFHSWLFWTEAESAKWKFACFCSYAVRYHCGANYFAINYLGAPANYCDECARIYSLVQERIYPGKNSRRMTRYMNWCTCTILPSSVPLLMRAVLQFRRASSAVIFILPSVIRGEATRRYSKKYFEQRYGDGIF